MEKSLAVLLATLATAPLDAPGAPRPQEALAHGVPAMSAATFAVADTMRMTIQSPMGPMEMTALAHATLAVGIEEDPGGYRATAEVVEFTGTVTNPMMGSQSMGGDAVRGAVVVLVGPTGVTELVGTPELSPEAGQFSMFQDLGYHMFPGLPGREAAVGDTWSDTISWSSSTEGMETSSTVARTYTLGDETVIDGRSLKRIAVSATVEISGSGTQGGMELNQELAGSVTGHYYWDAEAGLLHSAVLMREIAGRTVVTGAPPVEMTMQGPHRIVRRD